MKLLIMYFSPTSCQRSVPYIYKLKSHEQDFPISVALSTNFWVPMGRSEDAAWFCGPFSLQVQICSLDQGSSNFSKRGPH
jgi:hypothetical protein